ncbi:uncharacterized protein LOC123499935 [Portunus trituberculatus]|uniref:uncharacterized protein LOC123499935 n=1 Tax=Portunus trituberculatus TaxID=210409 RepID=UPI001E1CDBD5|nr:uncharacterized protein LOC123499935 [Portunus trituberculatus]
MYGWGALLDQPPDEPTLSTSGQILVGWWLVFCVIVSTGFRSSLVAHLTVQGTVKPVETLQDLVSANGWQWSAEPWLMNGILREYFSKNNDPVVKQVYEKTKVLDSERTLMKVLEGSFSFISFKNYVSVAVASKFAGSIEKSPFYFSKEGVSIMAVFGWHTRYGAPFQYRFSHIFHRLEDVGITSRWKDEVIARRIQENRDAVLKNPAVKYKTFQGANPQQEQEKVTYTE